MALISKPRRERATHDCNAAAHEELGDTRHNRSARQNGCARRLRNLTERLQRSVVAGRELGAVRRLDIIGVRAAGDRQHGTNDKFTYHMSSIGQPEGGSDPIIGGNDLQISTARLSATKPMAIISR